MDNFDFFHGIKANETKEKASPVLSVSSGIPFIVGTSPIHEVIGGKANELVLARNFKEAKEKLGYSDDWEKYTLCEAMYLYFEVYKLSPVIFVCVSDTTKEVKNFPSAMFCGSDHEAVIELEEFAVRDSIKVTGTNGEEAICGEDYYVTYGESAVGTEYVCKINMIKSDKFVNPEVGGKAADVTYDVLKNTGMPSAEAIIGGKDASTGAVTGLALCDYSFAKFGITPDIFLAPGHSDNETVAKALLAKAKKTCGLFSGVAVCDVTGSDYNNAMTTKKTYSFIEKPIIYCYGNIPYKGKVYHGSTVFAAVMTRTDALRGCPCSSPSNKEIYADGIETPDGKELLMLIDEANALNAEGIATFFNVGTSIVTWGNSTAYRPKATAPNEHFINVIRMFSWVHQMLIKGQWKKTDGDLTKVYIESVVDEINMTFNALRAENKIIDGRVELRAEDNSTEDILSGHIKYRIRLTPIVPGEAMEFVSEFDSVPYEEMMNSLFAA